MNAQRTMQTALRRMAVQRTPLLRTTVPSIATQARFVASSGDGTFGSTGEVTQTKAVGGGASEELVQQRLRRPVSPHLSIYKPQITWYGSSLNRITGSILSGGFYLFGVGYLVAPMFGWHLETATLAAGMASMGAASKFAIKFPLAWFATYHSLNGVRHLVWDTGATLGNKQVQMTGWFVVGSSVALAGYLATLGGA